MDGRFAYAYGAGRGVTTHCVNNDRVSLLSLSSSWSSARLRPVDLGVERVPVAVGKTDPILGSSKKSSDDEIEQFRDPSSINLYSLFKDYSAICTIIFFHYSATNDPLIFVYEAILPIELLQIM